MMLRAASSVLVGVAGAMVAAVKRGVQATVPSELTQGARMSARVLIFADSVRVPRGRLEPGARPVAALARLAAMAKAFWRPAALVAEAPMRAPGPRNCERAQAVATVVTSLIWTKVAGVRLPQLPRAAVRTRAELEVPGVRPGLPPRATR